MRKISTGTHNSPMLRDQHDRFLHSRELMNKLGFTNQRLPREGFGPREVEGVTFLCRPAKYPKGEGRSSPHRLLFECKCKRFIPFGRANQHKCPETAR